jgi:hypothetical protein
MAVVAGNYVPLVGDVLLEARALIPDSPNTLPVPVATALVVGGGSTLPVGTYNVIVTQLNYWGETLGGTEIPGLVVGANQRITVTSPLLPGANKIRAYLTLPFGATPGSECQFIESTVSPFQISTPLPNAGNPPVNNSAFNPDTDGQLLSTSSVYRYLNDGLKIISRVAGGLLDYCGVGSVQGQPLYTIPGQWNEITSLWYDGYWMLGGDRASFFRRTTIQSSVLSAGTVSVQDNRNIIEVYPQPARTAAVTIIDGASPMSATDTSAVLSDASGFLLPFGFIQVETEIMAYSQINGNIVSGLIRGLGGSTAIAHPASSPVNELNIFWSGKRQFAPTFIPGNSTSILPIPNGWDVLLIQYVAGRAKLVEHDFEAFKSFDDQMEKSIKSWALTNKGVVRRRQIGGDSSPSSYYGDQAGGLIVP